MANSCKKCWLEIGKYIKKRVLLLAILNFDAGTTYMKVGRLIKL